MIKEEFINNVILSEAGALLKNLPSNSIPLMILDPPYGIGYHSGHYKDKNPHAPIANDWNFQLSSFIVECERVLEDNGAIYLFCRWDISPLWVPLIIGSNLKVKAKIAWVKNNWTAGDLEGSFGNQYEEILFITKGRHLLRGKRWSNVWFFDKVHVKKLLNPAQKPVPLLARIISASSDEGDIILDTFAGSGSTGVASKNSNRKFILGDIDPKMIKVSKLRLGMEREKLEEVATSIDFTFPEPAEWNLHPEQVKEIYEELKGNIYFNDVEECFEEDFLQPFHINVWDSE